MLLGCFRILKVDFYGNVFFSLLFTLQLFAEEHTQYLLFKTGFVSGGTTQPTENQRGLSVWASDGGCKAGKLQSLGHFFLWQSHKWVSMSPYFYALNFLHFIVEPSRESRNISSQNASKNLCSPNDHLSPERFRLLFFCRLFQTVNVSHRNPCACQGGSR